MISHLLRVASRMDRDRDRYGTCKAPFLQPADDESRDRNWHTIIEKKRLQMYRIPKK